MGAVGRLAELELSAAAVTSLPALLGIEGAAAGMYFGAIRHAITPGYGFDRRHRSDRDLINVLINYCSALLRETVVSALLCAGLDPYLSFLHTPSRGRPTLAFDLMEEWRPVLLESTVLALVGLRAVTAQDLTPNGDGVSLSADAIAAAVTRFQARLAMPARGWPPPPGAATYGDLVRRQARALRAALLESDVDYVPFRWR